MLIVWNVTILIAMYVPVVPMYYWRGFSRLQCLISASSYIFLLPWSTTFNLSLEKNSEKNIRPDRQLDHFLVTHPPPFFAPSFHFFLLAQLTTNISGAFYIAWVNEKCGEF